MRSVHESVAQYLLHEIESFILSVGEIIAKVSM